VSRVLFTGGGGAGNEALWRLLGNRYELHFADADPEAFDPAITRSRCHVIPLGSADGFVDELAKLCRRIEIDLLVPGVDEELLPLARNSKHFGPTRLLIPSLDYIETMLDKFSTARRLAAAAIPVPRTQLTNVPCEIPFPCIAKPRRGRGSRDVRVVRGDVDLSLLVAVSDSSGIDMVLQEKIVGDEYTVMMAADQEGRLAAVVPVKVGLKRGITLRARTEAEPTVMAACKAIHHAIPTPGCYNVQLILTRGGEALPFEINPRISTTFCLSVAAGIDPIAIFFGHIQIPSSDLLAFQVGIELRRYWRNHIQWLGRNEI